MNPPDQPTPRTDAMLNGCEWGNRQDQAHTALCRTLERELAAAKEECDLNRTRLASIFWSGAMDKHTGGDVQKWNDDYTAELTNAKAEASHYMSIAQKATDDLTFFRADNLKAHQMTCAAALERDRLRAEVERLLIIEKQFKQSPMWDTLAIVQTRNNWQARAEKAEAELAEAKVERETVAQSSLRSLEAYIDKLKQFAERAEKAEAECLEQARLLGMSGEREADLLGKLGRLEKDKERLDWLHLTADGINWQTIDNTHLVTRDAIDAAMKGTP
jgi:fused signal recognition particle receptor